jgi:hypothetical protein
LDEEFFDGIREQIYAIYDYNSSAYGIMEGISNKYKNMEFDIDKLSEELSDKNNMGFLKDVITKLG